MTSFQRYSHYCSADFLDPLPKFPLNYRLACLPSTKDRLQSDGTTRALREGMQEEAVLDLAIEKIGELAIVECHGKVVRSDAVFKLCEAVTSLPGMGIIVLDLSQVSAIEASGLDMLLFLQRWAYDRDIQLKLFNPRMSLRDRLERGSSMPEFDIATLQEVLAVMLDANSRFALAV